MAPDATRAASDRADVNRDGVLTLQQAIRRTGHSSVPVARMMFPLVGRSMSRGLVDYSPEAVRYLMRRGCYSSEKVRALGYRPGVDLAEGMDRTVRWLASRS